MRKIKKIFRAIVNWVKENPPVQPLLIILVIFVAIFGLTQVGTVANWVGDLFDQGKSKPEEVYYKDIEDWLDNPRDDNFLLIYGKESCSACESFLDDVVNRFLKSKSKIPTYYFDQDYAVDEEKYTEIAFEQLRERLIENRLNYMDYFDEVLVNDPTSLPTPTLYFFKEGQTYRAQVGTLSYQQLKNFVNASPGYRFKL